MNSYDRIYTLLTEDARLDKKLASARRKAKAQLQPKKLIEWVN